MRVDRHIKTSQTDMPESLGIQQIHNMISDSMEQCVIRQNRSNLAMQDRHQLIAFEPTEEFKFTMPEEKLWQGEEGYNQQLKRVRNYYRQCSQYFKKETEGEVITGMRAVSFNTFYNGVIFKDRRPINPTFKQVEPIPTTLRKYKIVCLRTIDEVSGVSAGDETIYVFLSEDIIRKGVTDFLRAGNYDPTDMEVLNLIKNCTRFNMTNVDYNNLYIYGPSIIRFEIKKYQVQGLIVKQCTDTRISKYNELINKYQKEHEAVYEFNINNNAVTDEMYRIMKDILGVTEDQNEQSDFIRVDKFNKRQWDKYIESIFTDLLKCCRDVDWKSIVNNTSKTCYDVIQNLISKFIELCKKLKDTTIPLYVKTKNLFSEFYASIYNFVKGLNEAQDAKSYITDYTTRLLVKQNKTIMDTVFCYIIRMLYVTYQFFSNLWEKVKSFFVIHDVEKDDYIDNEESKRQQLSNSIKQIKAKTKSEKKIRETLVNQIQNRYVQNGVEIEEAVNRVNNFMSLHNKGYEIRELSTLIDSILEPASDSDYEEDF